MKRLNATVILLAVAIVIVAANLNGNFVSADPCVATLNSPVPAGYVYSNVPVVVPVSVTCTTYYGNQLYAAGNAYDTSSGATLGSVTAVLQSVNGGTAFNGQLGFNLPPTSQGDVVQVYVSIFNSQYGSPITATSETFQIGSATQQVSTTTVTDVYPYPNLTEYPPSQYAYPIESAPNQNSFPSHHHWGLWQTRSGLLFGYIAIVAILGVVIITTAALVVYGRRQPNWIPFQPPPHS